MTHAPKPRLVCRAVRLWREISDSSDATPGARSAHVENCPDCQAFFQSSGRLVSDLRQQAPHTPQPMPDDLARRISLAVRETAPRHRRKRLPLHYASLLGATIAAAVAITVILPRNSPRPGSQTAAVDPSRSSLDVADIVANVDTLSIKFLDSVEPSAANFATNNPLSRELDNVRADARSAIGYLALNFLPEGAAQQARSGSDNT